MAKFALVVSYCNKASNKIKDAIVFWLLGCRLFKVSLENISFIWRRHHYRWRTAKFRRLFGKIRLFIVPHLLWHGASVFAVSPKAPPPFSSLVSEPRGTEDLFYTGSSRGCFQKIRPSSIWRCLILLLLSYLFNKVKIVFLFSFFKNTIFEKYKELYFSLKF